MNTKTLEQFNTLNADILGNIEGGDRKGYCSALIAGRILRKKFLNQPITQADYTCN